MYRCIGSRWGVFGGLKSTKPDPFPRSCTFTPASCWIRFKFAPCGPISFRLIKAIIFKSGSKPSWIDSSIWTRGPSSPGTPRHKCTTTPVSPVIPTTASRPRLLASWVSAKSPTNKLTIHNNPTLPLYPQMLPVSLFNRFKVRFMAVLVGSIM